VVSSDHIRGIISDDESSQDVSAQAFDILYRITRYRLQLGRLTIVDATNVSTDSRRPLLSIAVETNAPTVAIVFDVPLDECLSNAAGRSSRRVPPEVVKSQFESLESSLLTLHDEGFDRIVLLESSAIVRSAAVNIG